MIRIRQIHQIEITSRCNLRCPYCVHPSMSRVKMDMPFETFKAAIRWAEVFKKRGSQGPINLAGIGESTLHPMFLEFLAFARQALGADQKFVLATNGIEISKHPSLADRIVEALSPWIPEARPEMFVSLHRPERGGPAVEHLKRVGLLSGVSVDAAVSATDWAGQVNWHVSAMKGAACPWVRGGWVIVLSDGRMSRCAFDGTGIGTIKRTDGRDAYVCSDNLAELSTAPYLLCKSCHQDVGVPFSNEEAA